jgi:hypothetical protein
MAEESSALFPGMRKGFRLARLCDILIERTKARLPSTSRSFHQILVISSRRRVEDIAKPITFCVRMDEGRCFNLSPKYSRILSSVGRDRDSCSQCQDVWQPQTHHNHTPQAQRRDHCASRSAAHKARWCHRVESLLEAGKFCNFYDVAWRDAQTIW